MTQLPKSQLDQLKDFVALLKGNPAILNDPELAFFRDYLASIGAKIPATSKDKPQNETPESQAVPPNESEAMEQDGTEDQESDLELDMTGVMESDQDPPQEMGNCIDDQEIEISDQQMDDFNAKRGEAMAALGDADWSKAVELFTAAIKINSKSAAVYAKRGNCFLKLGRPNACIRDCDRAIKLNPDSAAAYKFRGRANRLLGRFVEAAKDLRVACKLDFDEVADEWLKEVTPNAKKIEEHERKKQRKREENEIKEKKDKIQKAREAREQAYKKAKETPSPEMPKGMGGMFQDKEIMAALQDILSNPGNVSKYNNNPKVMSALNQMMGQMGGASFPSGMGGMFGMGEKTGGTPFGSGHNHNPASGTATSSDVPKTSNGKATTTDDLD